MHVLLHILILFVGISITGNWKLTNAAAPHFSKSITVAPSGGDFTTISEAIMNGVPINNTQWIRIHIGPGEYKEQIIIPKTKPYIVLEGVSSRTTTIVFCSGRNTGNATIVIQADNIVARRLCFKNTYNLVDNGNTKAQAVAAKIRSDKVSFYKCRFLSVQDTVYDQFGRHFFKSCYIQGSTDFIFGNGQSVYESCKINVTGSGYITAQGREGPKETTGFVFKQSKVYGIGKAYLGRAWQAYSRVIFYQTRLSSIVVPQGWNAWNFQGHEANLTYAEVDCSGPGSNTSNRVAWEKKLMPEELEYFIGPSFHNADGWIEKQP